MASGTVEVSWKWITWAEGRRLKPPVGTSGDWGWLKTSKSETWTTSSSSLIVGREGTTSSSAVYWKGSSTCCTPSRVGPGLRRLSTAMLIKCRRRSFALIMY